MRIIQYSFIENKLRHRIRLFFAAMQMGSVNKNNKENEKRFGLPNFVCPFNSGLLISRQFVAIFMENLIDISSFIIKKTYQVSKIQAGLMPDHFNEKLCSYIYIYRATRI